MLNTVLVMSVGIEDRMCKNIQYSDGFYFVLCVCV